MIVLRVREDSRAREGEWKRKEVIGQQGGRREGEKERLNWRAEGKE